MSSYIKAELAATCSSLGRLHNGQYIIDDECYESVRDLIRYLRRDDEYHEVRQYLGQAKVLQSDLIPVVKHCPRTSPHLLDIVVRLLVNLTNPVLLLYREEVPSERVGRNLYMALIAHSQDYKAAFCDIEFWNVVCAKLTDLFEVDWSERSEDDSLQIERLLVLLRNVLQVPADTEQEQRPENDVTVHDKVLWALRQSQVLELLLYVSSSAGEQQYFLHLLEIFSLILREQNPTLLARSEIRRPTAEKERDANDLIDIRELEKEVTKKFRNQRSFRPTFVLKNVKSISEQDVIYHRSLDSLSDLKLTQDKRRVKTPRNRVPLESERLERRSTFSVRLFLKEFCVELLNCSFNSLMGVVKDKLVAGKGLSNDESYYFWALKFFLEFNCAHNLDVKLISECVNSQSFHFIQTQMETCFERLTADKKKTPIWVRRIHLILKAYHSLLKTLQWMDTSKDGSLHDTARVLKSNIFYVPEYRELMLYCLGRYDPTKYPISYLRDLIETTHLFVKLLEDFCKKSRVVVQQKKRRKQGPGRKIREPPRVETREEKWDKVNQEVMDLLTGGGGFPEIPPFDAVLDIPDEEQKERAVRRIQGLLHRAASRDAIGLLRSAREVWPEGNIFGFPDMPVEEEAMALQEICLADLGPVEPTPEDSEDMDQDEDEEDQPGPELAERNFDFKDYLKRLATKKIVEGCCIMLRNYKKNSTYTNHCVAKLLHRIGWECHMPAMLFQATLFLTLLQILNEKNPRYKELQKFTVHLTRKFRENAVNNPKLFMEILFWKDPKIAFDIENGYGKYDESNKLGAVWTGEDEEALKRLWGECADIRMEKDKVEYVRENLPGDPRSSAAVVKKLKQMDLVPKGFRANAKLKCPTEWIEEEVEELRKLFGDFREAIDPVSMICDRLTLTRPKKRIKEKLLELGLVGSLEELRKKRRRRTAGQDADPNPESESDPSDDDGEDNATSYTLAEKKEALRKVEAMTEALEWVKETLEECLEEDDDSTGYPLLALDAAHSTALDNDDFVDMLRKLGIEEPVESQIYWKIPKTDRNDVKEKLGLIERCLRKDLKDDGSDSENNEDEFEKLKGMLGTERRDLRNGEWEVSDEEPVGRRRIGSDSSQSEESVGLDVNDSVRRNGKKKKKRSVVKPIDSDRSDDEENGAVMRVKRSGCLGSDSDPGEDAGETGKGAWLKQKRRRCIGSDSELEESASGEEGHGAVETAVKRPKMIDSDSDLEGNGSLDENDAGRP